MKNDKTTLLIVSCIVFLLFVFYFLNKMQSMRYVQSSLTDLISNMQIKEDFYSNNLRTGYLMNGINAPDVSYLEDVHEKKIVELAKDKPVLICIYKIECSMCEKDELKELHSIFNDTIENIENVYILCSNFIRREVYVYTKKNHLNISVYGISPTGSFDWIAEEYNKPYYFVLHPDMRISHFYLPDKKYPIINKQYLEGVKSYLSTYK